MAPLLLTVRIPTLLAIFYRRQLRRDDTAEISRKTPLSFVIFRLDSLGDVVLTTPLFRALKSSYPGSRSTVVVQPSYKSLLATNPHVDEILTLPRIETRFIPQRAKRFLAALVLYWTRLRKRRFNIAISPRWDVDEHLATFLCALTRAGKKVGYTSETSTDKRLMNAGFDAAFDVCMPAGPVCHEVQRNLATAQAVGATAIDDRLEIEISDRDRREAARILSVVPAGAKMIALGIGANSPGRRWPLRRYAKVIEGLRAEGEVQTVIVCSSTELGAALELDTCLKKRAVIVSGARLRVVCAVLERCELFVGNDSGCAHLAAAMGCKTVVISRHPRSGDSNHFNSPVRFSPRGPQVTVLQPESGRDGCVEGCVERRPHCITAVTVEQVVLVARQMLNTRATYAAAPQKPWMTKASQRLLRVHGLDAVQQALDSLRSERPLP